MVRAVLFDLDDTLHDKSATLSASARSQYISADLASLGVSTADWEAQYIELNNLRIEKAEVFARLRSQFCLSPEITTSLLAEFDANLGAMAKPFSGALDLVRSCRARGQKVGIITNGRDQFQRSKIVGLGICNDVDTVVTSGELGIKKPDLRIFRVCLDRLNIEPNAVAFVGDDFKSDMEPALELGMCAIWKSPASSPRVAFSSDNLREIQEYLSAVALPRG